MIRLLFSSLIFFQLFLTGCDNDEEQATELPRVNIDIHDYAREHFPGAVPTESGMYIIVQHQGTGAKPVRDELLYVFYRGELLNGVVFDSTRTRPMDADLPATNRIFKFRLETGSVIQGWHEGFAQLNKGSRAVFLIPPQLGYGETQTGRIPKGSALRFDVELLDIK